MKWELLCKRTDFPKLGYIIHRLKEAGIPYKLSNDPYLRQVWIFAQARNDAWNRDPPTNMKIYEEVNGMPWKDERIFDVGRKSY